MKIYMNCHGSREGLRAEGNVIHGAEGYTVTELCLPGERTGWEMYRRSYKTLWQLLRAVARKGHYADTASAGI